jgi:eukaryotic-like serine/threonine-protein kinase
VPAGEFWMGSLEGDSEAYDDEKPRHRVFVDAFWIDRTEVTNAQYRQCVEAGVCSPPGQVSSTTRESYYGNPEYDDYPVVHISWDQARAYAGWVGGRLPTEAEWEYACRGPGESTYPWGNDSPDEALLNYGDNVGDTTEAGSYPEGKSWCGALDMGGNVGEWTRSLWGQGYSEPEFKYPYDPADGREDESAGQDVVRVLRGGALLDDARYVRCAVRHRNLPDVWLGYLGMRIVLGPGFPSGR